MTCPCRSEVAEPDGVADTVTRLGLLAAAGDEPLAVAAAFAGAPTWTSDPVGLAVVVELPGEVTW